MRRRATSLITLFTLATGAMLSLSVRAATNTNWIDDPDNRGTEAAPIDIYNAAKWTSGALPSSNWNLNFTAGGLTYITNSTTKQIATALRFGGGDFVVFGPMRFDSFGYNISETAPVSIDKRGDWTGDGRFFIATKDESSFALTNTTGNLLSKNNAMRVGSGNNTTSAFVLQNGALTCLNNNCTVGYGEGSIARFEQNGGTATFGQTLYIGRNGTNVEYVVNGGETVVSNGIVFASSKCYYDDSLRIKLFGGTFETPKLVWHNGVDNTRATVLLNGGTLKAAAGADANFTWSDQDESESGVRSRFRFLIGARGGTITPNAQAISIHPAIVSDVPADGGLTIKGGGSLTLTGGIAYNGPTTVELGSSLVVPTTAVGSGVVFAKPAGFGRALYVPMSISGNDTLEDVFAAAERPNDPDARFVLSSDKKKILCYYKLDGIQDPYWIGGPTGNLGDGANWSTGTAPQGGNCYISSGECNAMFTNSASFRPDSITFMEGSKSVTIIGTDDITGITAITNLSAANHTINVPVRFADKILVVQDAKGWSTRDKASVRFAGGVYGTTFAKDTARYLNGAFNLSDGSDWGATTTGNNGGIRWGIPEGSSLTIPSATNTSELALGNTTTEPGGAFTTGVMRTSSRILYWNNGEFVVTKELYLTLSAARHLAYRYSDGWFKFEKLTIGASTGGYRFYFANDGDFRYDKFVRVGAGGIGFEEGIAADKNPNYQFGRRENDTTTITPWYSDFMIGTKGRNGKLDLRFCAKTSTTFDTTDEQGTGRTITINAHCADPGAVNITGKGAVVVNNPENECNGAVTVSDTATLALNAGCPFGTGAVTVSNATLRANSSGTVAFANKVVCQADAALAFNFTEKRTAPCLAFNSGVTGNAMPTTLNVRVTAANGILPAGRRHTLTTGYDFTDTTLTLVDPPGWVQLIGKDASGNIVLDVKSNGTVIIFQ